MRLTPGLSGVVKATVFPTIWRGRLRAASEALFVSDKRVGFSIAGQTPVLHDPDLLVGYAPVSTLDLVLQSGRQRIISTTTPAASAIIDQRRSAVSAGRPSSLARARQ